VRTYRARTRQVAGGQLDRVFAELEAEARAQLAVDGFGPAAMQLARSADLRYQGQSFELTVAIEPGPLDGPAIARLDEAFAREHERTYGHRAGPQEPVELIALRLVARGVPAAPRVPDRVVHDREHGGEVAAARRAYFGRERRWLETLVIRRADLAGGRPGPLIVEEYDATGLVPPGWHATLGEAGNILLTSGADR